MSKQPEIRFHYPTKLVNSKKGRWESDYPGEALECRDQPDRKLVSTTRLANQKRDWNLQEELANRLVQFPTPAGQVPNLSSR